QPRTRGRRAQLHRRDAHFRDALRRRRRRDALRRSGAGAKVTDMLLLLLAAMQFDWQCRMRDASAGKPFLRIAVKEGEKGPIIGMGNGEELQIIEGAGSVFKKIISDKAGLEEPGLQAGIRAAGVSREAVDKAIIFGAAV